MSNVNFRVIKEIPDGLSSEIQLAVKDFMLASDLDGVDPQGFYNLTLQSIANSTYMNGGGEFWIGTDENNEIVVYILAGISNDIDGRLCYSVSQAWVRSDYRGNPVVKEWWKAIRARAKDLLCSHLQITSSRGFKAYERFLGHGMRHYADILKEIL